jgi:hypothetical protein
LPGKFLLKMSLNRLNGRLNRKVPNSLDSGLDRIAKSRNNKLVVEAILSRTGQHQQDLVDSDPLPISR